VQKKKKKVYIAHPFRNDPQGNMKKVGMICTDIIRGHPDILPVSPLHNFAYLPPEEDVIDHCIELLSNCDELWVFGDWEESAGCRAEVKYALETDKKIICWHGYDID